MIAQTSKLQFTYIRIAIVGSWTHEFFTVKEEKLNPYTAETLQSSNWV